MVSRTPWTCILHKDILSVFFVNLVSEPCSPASKNLEACGHFSISLLYESIGKLEGTRMWLQVLSESGIRKLTSARTLDALLPSAVHQWVQARCIGLHSRLLSLWHNVRSTFAASQNETLNKLDRYMNLDDYIHLRPHRKTIISCAQHTMATQLGQSGAGCHL